MGKPTICIGENKDADQLRSNCEADQRLCFRFTDFTILCILNPKPSALAVQAGLCRTWSEPKLLVFSRTGSFHFNAVKPINLNFSKIRVQYISKCVKI